MTFRILHISDLHFGEACKFGLDGTTAAQALTAEIRTHGFEKFSAVIVSGDFTNRNGKREFEASRDFVTQLATALALPLANFVLIPGNHDIIWSEPDDQLFRRFRYLYREQAERAFREFLGSLGLSVTPYLMQVKLFHDDDVAIVGFNSCGVERKSAAGFGYLGRDQIEAAIQKLREDPGYRTREANFFKIAVLHHHLLPTADLDMSELEKPPHDRHFSLTLDACSVLNLLLSDNFALALHGHVHVPFCGVERRVSLTEDKVGMPHIGHLAVVAAGSLSANPPQCSRNQFQIIEIAEKTVSFHCFERDPLDPTFERPGATVRLLRHLITRPPASLALREPEVWRESLHERTLQESSLLAELVLIDRNIAASSFLWDIIVPNAKRHEVLSTFANEMLEDSFESALASLRAERDPMAAYENRKELSRVTFPEYILRLMAAHAV